jgi:hypothetical protein
MDRFNDIPARDLKEGKEAFGHEMSPELFILTIDPERPQIIKSENPAASLQSAARHLRATAADSTEGGNYSSAELPM